jgi:hypothetical protein
MVDAPDSIPQYIVEGLGKQDADTLQDIADYAVKLADQKAREAQRRLQEQSERDLDETPDDWDDDEWDDVVDDARDEADLPSSKGTITSKTIDGRDYYYLQWRDGDKIRSQYVAPVSPAQD